MIPHEYIEELTRRTDIVELVGSYVQLKRKGRLYGGLCPFHSEKTPSFYVYPDTQSFYCFGCGAGGDAITFTKKINSIDYPEAVKLLAARAGMPEPQEDDKTGRMRSRILSMNKEAARFFHACLNSTVEEARQARAYWRRRGLDDKTIVRFGLGYAPNDGQALYQFLRDKGYNQQELDASGLFKRSASGRIYCLFWKRVMTPIFDLRGNIIAFGGRVLDDSKPKYVNSPETLVYHKSDTVFALQIAKKSASRRFVLCEGYMDVISMHQAGIDTAVCACGTALTPEQVRLISEYADEVILSYDSDEAGQKATLRSLELFRNSPVKVGVLQIPGAKDPDEYIRKFGAPAFRQVLGFMPQSQGMYDDMTAWEFLLYMAQLKGLRPRAAREQLRELLQVVNLWDAAHRRVGGFSGGMRQRVMLAQALLGAPKVLLLDEPTAGLDPEERVRLREYIRQLGRDKIVLITTHITGDVESIASEILLLHHGVLLADAPAEEFIRGCGAANLEDAYIRRLHPHA